MAHGDRRQDSGYPIAPWITKPKGQKTLLFRTINYTLRVCLMASFFRASCALYWLVWLVVMSYAIGISVYEAGYVIVQNDAYIRTSCIVKMLCYICAGFSFLGCIFVKCDISHLGCFILYTAPLLIGVPGLSIYGLTVNFRNNAGNGSLLLDSKKLMDMAQTHWNKYNTTPWWLTKTELALDCCGIHSYKDYQLLLSPKSPDYEGLPITCCRDYRGHKKGVVDVHCLKDIANFSTPRNMTGKPPDTLDYPWEQDVYKNAFDKPDFPLLTKNDYKKILSVNGCGKEIVRHHINAMDAHESFFVVIMVCSVLMFVVYVKSWCDGRHFSGGASEHSLDVENVSVTNIADEVERKSNADATSLMVKPSAQVIMWTPSQMIMPVPTPSQTVMPTLAQVSVSEGNLSKFGKRR